MRTLPRFAVNPQLHRQIVRVGNLVGSHDPGTQRAESIDSLAEAEYAGFHLAPLNIARGDVVKNDIASNVCGCFFRRKMFTAFFQNDGKFEFVIQFLREMLRINNWLLMSDNGVDVLKEDDPRHHGMGKSRLGGFFVVLPEVASRVKKLAGNDWRLEFDVGSGVKD